MGRGQRSGEGGIMYALINTMSQIPSDSIGTVASLHRSIEAAERAAGKLQRLTRRGNGQNSYIPTQIVRLSCAYRRGEHVSPSSVVREERSQH